MASSIFCCRAFVGVESRRGAVTGGHWPSLRFHSPLIEPDVRISRIRLSDRLHGRTHDRQSSSCRRSLLGSVWRFVVLLGSSPIASPLLLHKHARSEDPSLHQHYPVSAVLRSSPTPVWSAMLATALGPTRSDRPPLITRIALPACCDHYPGGPERVHCPVSFPVPRGLPRYPGGSASASLLSRPAQDLHVTAHWLAQPP